MKKAGLYIAIFGLLSIILSFIGLNLRILVWIDAWGPTVAWMIRGGMVVLGLIIYFLAGKMEADE